MICNQLQNKNKNTGCIRRLLSSLIGASVKTAFKYGAALTWSLQTAARPPSLPGGEALGLAFPMGVCGDLRCALCGSADRKWPSQGHTAQGAQVDMQTKLFSLKPRGWLPQGQLSWHATAAQAPGYSLVWPHLRSDTQNPGFFFLKSTTRATYVLHFRPRKARISPRSPPNRFPLPCSHSSRIPSPRALS